MGLGPVRPLMCFSGCGSRDSEGGGDPSPPPQMPQCVNVGGRYYQEVAVGSAGAASECCATDGVAITERRGSDSIPIGLTLTPRPTVTNVGCSVDGWLRGGSGYPWSTDGVQGLDLPIDEPLGAPQGESPLFDRPSDDVDSPGQADQKQIDELNEMLSALGISGASGGDDEDGRPEDPPKKSLLPKFPI